MNYWIYVGTRESVRVQVLKSNEILECSFLQAPQVIVSQAPKYKKKSKNNIHAWSCYTCMKQLDVEMPILEDRGQAIWKSS